MFDNLVLINLLPLRKQHVQLISLFFIHSSLISIFSNLLLESLQVLDLYPILIRQFDVQVINPSLQLINSVFIIRYLFLLPILHLIELAFQFIYFGLQLPLPLGILLLLLPRALIAKVQRSLAASLGPVLPGEHEVDLTPLIFDDGPQFILVTDLVLCSFSISTLLNLALVILSDPVLYLFADLQDFLQLHLLDHVLRQPLALLGPPSLLGLFGLVIEFEDIHFLIIIWITFRNLEGLFLAIAFRNSLRANGSTSGGWIAFDPLLQLAKPAGASALLRRLICHLWAFFLIFVDFIYF